MLRIDNVAVVIRLIAGVIAAIVVLVLPLGYFTVAYRSLASELSIEANFRSGNITHFINERPLQWTISEHHLDELLTRNPPLRDRQWNRLFKADGEEIMRKGVPPPWPALTMSTPVYDAGAVVGTLEVQYSIKPILLNTLFAALFGLALGGGIFFTLRVLPLRALERTTAALRDEIARHEGARAAAEAANRSKSQFLAAASHDLRQPMHSLGLFAASLSERVTDPAVRGIADNISASVEALESLFNELLDISRLDAGIVKPNLANFALEPLFERMRLDFAPAAREKGIELVIRSTRAVAHSDPILVERVLRNLIVNAIRYTAQGGVLVGCRPRADQWSIEVWDSGVGIAPENLERIFEEFYQVGNPERDRRKGLGLGLAIIRRIEGLIGSRIRVASRPGHGSMFAFSVSRGRLAAAVPEAIHAEPFQGGLRNKCVLVVDDEAAVREGMRTLLSGWGCDVVAADSLHDALERIAAHARRPDLIIADYRLRDAATGLEVIEKLHAEFGRDIAALLITGDTSADRLREVRASGYPQLYKPVSPAKLREVVSAMLKVV